MQCVFADGSYAGPNLKGRLAKDFGATVTSTTVWIFLAHIRQLTRKLPVNDRKTTIPIPTLNTTSHSQVKVKASCVLVKHIDGDEEHQRGEYLVQHGSARRERDGEAGTNQPADDAATDELESDKP